MENKPPKMLEKPLVSPHARGQLNDFMRNKPLVNEKVHSKIFENIIFQASKS